MFLHGILHGSASERSLMPRTKAETETAMATATTTANATGNGDIVENMHVKLVTQELLPKAKEDEHSAAAFATILRSMEEILTKAAIHFSIPRIQKTCTCHVCVFVQDKVLFGVGREVIPCQVILVLWAGSQVLGNMLKGQLAAWQKDAFRKLRAQMR